MDLTPRQLFALNEMGIPVWELRPDNGSQLITAVSNEIMPTNYDDVLAQISACRLIVLTSTLVTNEQEKRLLHALVSSLGVKFNDFVLMTNDEFVVIESQLSTSDQKLLLILGDESTSRFIEDAESNHVVNKECYTTKISQWPAYISLSLSELLKKTELKASVWQDLKLLKSQLTAS